MTSYDFKRYQFAACSVENLSHADAGARIATRAAYNHGIMQANSFTQFTTVTRKKTANAFAVSRRLWIRYSYICY